MQSWLLLTVNQELNVSLRVFLYCNTAAYCLKQEITAKAKFKGWEKEEHGKIVIFRDL